jgi:hypothetical protein
VADRAEPSRLFDLPPASPDTQPSQFRDSTATVSRMRDSRSMQKLVRVATAASQEQDDLERARLVTELERLTGSALERAIVGAHRAGYSWRTIGTYLGIPYQTLHRRFGAGGV